MKGRYSNWIWYLAGILLFLTLLSIHLTGGLYARYTAAGSGSDSARVAAFQVEVTGDGVTAQCTESQDGTYTLTVENASEVAVEFTVSVTTKSTLNVTVTSDSALTGQLAPGGSASRILTFSLEDWSQVTKDAHAGTLATEVAADFTVHVDTVQID